MDNFCSRIKEKLKEKMPAHSFNMWIDPLSINLENGNKVIVECKNSFFKKRILENYSEIIKKVLAEDTEKTNIVVDFTESSTLNLKKKPKKKQLSKNIVKPTQREKHLFSDNKQMSFLETGLNFKTEDF